MNRAGTSLHAAYGANRGRPIAYIDETYNVDGRHGRLYYVMAAVVVQAAQVANIRAAIVRIAGSSYWHTSEEIRSAAGRQRTIEMLQYLGDPGGDEF